MPFNPFTALTSKIFGFGLFLSLVTLGPALWITRDKLKEAREEIASLLDWQTEMVQTVRIASENPDVDASTAKAQVQELGFVRVKLKSALETQNDALDAMERQSREALAIAAQAEKRRKAAVAKAERLKRELMERARSPVPADQVEIAVRETQDIVFQEGL